MGVAANQIRSPIDLRSFAFRQPDGQFSVAIKVCRIRLVRAAKGLQVAVPDFPRRVIVSGRGR